MNMLITDCGASDKCLDNAKFIQKAIDIVFENGGGKVIVPRGVFLSSTILLKDNIELEIQKDAVLKACDEISSFSIDKKKEEGELDIPSYQNCDYDGKPKLYFICAFHSKNIKISGEGIIDGNEQIFYGYQDRYFIDGKFYPRMPLLFLEDIQNLIISNIKLQKSAFWTVHMVGCRYVLIDNVKIENNLKLANCDGIDPDHCQNVEIRNCKIKCADDAIVFKNTFSNQKYGDLEKIHVCNCDLMTTSGAIKFGTESFGRFHDIHIENISIHDSNRGITIQLRDEGSIDHCLFENMRISTRAFAKPYYWGYGEPICITALKRDESTNLKTVSDLTFRNVMIDSENGIFIYGEENSISNITFENISLNLHKKSKWNIDKKDLRPYDVLPFIEDDKIHVIQVYSSKNVEFNNFMYMIDASYQNSVEDFKVEKSSNIILNNNRIDD